MRIQSISSKSFTKVIKVFSLSDFELNLLAKSGSIQLSIKYIMYYMYYSIIVLSSARFMHLKHLTETLKNNGSCYHADLLVKA